MNVKQGNRFVDIVQVLKYKVAAKLDDDDVTRIVERYNEVDLQL